jgi:xanthine dehydrogenase small subunit
MVSNSIRFIFENKIKEIKNPDPNETILNHIRLELKKTGTKEGCAEGGCGACTVVVGELKKNKITYKAINSCIAFTTSLEGKHLLVIEDLTQKNGSLHPVQSAMINFHGSQCGFCTPGFIMSLFSMYKNKTSYDKKTIEESISGNLCRCTGYRPIIDAAKSLKKNKPDQFKKNEKKTISLLKKNPTKKYLYQ